MQNDLLAIIDDLLTYLFNNLSMEHSVFLNLHDYYNVKYLVGRTLRHTAKIHAGV